MSRSAGFERPARVARRIDRGSEVEKPQARRVAKDGRKAIPDWDRSFAEGRWDYLDDTGEAGRYALIAGYIHRRQGPSSVLDVGCGAGLLCRYLDHARVRYRGIDLSPTAIAQAAARFPSRRFEVGDIADHRPPPDETFDAIVFNEVLPHVAEPIRSLDRWTRYLTASGVIVISTFRNANPASNAALFIGLLDEELRRQTVRRLTGCEVTTFERGLTWRIDVLAVSRGRDGPG